ncbi:MAG: hypothetical protein WCG09_10370 [Halobacteriota archaeon]
MRQTDPNKKPIALSVIREGIPHCLAALPNWVPWSYSWDDNEGAWTKPPYHGASSTVPETWHTFDDAYELYQRLGLDGLFIALPGDRSITASDLDDCFENGSLKSDAQTIVNDLNTYTEYSPSNNGLRAFNLGPKPGDACRRPKEHTNEMYDHARFMSVTGHCYNGTPGTLNDDQDAIASAYTELFGEIMHSEPQSEQRERSGERMRDSAVIKKAMAAKDGDKFRRLFVDGDTSDYNCDDSAADMALCSLLRFWCGDDPVQIDGLFRESELYRSKWDEPRGRSTYGERTIQKALDTGGDVYTSGECPRNAELASIDTNDADKRYARALEILEDEDPIAFILDTYNKLHIGDRDVGEGILLGAAAQSVLNSLGVPSKLTGDSGKGKSHAARAMMHVHPQEYVLYASLTDKAIWYHPNIRAGITIFSDDVTVSPELEAIIKRSTSNFQRETTRVVPIKESGKYVGTTQTIPARINWLLTSVRTQGSEELIKRQLGYDVDTSEAQDKAYIEFEKLRALKCVEEFPITEDVLTCREIIGILKENEDGSPRIMGVDIPFSRRIVWTDTENRRNFNIFMDMVRSFAMFRFMQRERSEEGNIIATEADFNDAKRHYSARAGMQALHLDETQKKFCQHLAAEGGEADTPTMQARMKLTRQAVYNIANRLEEIYWRFSSENRTVPTDDSETKTTNKRFYVLNFDGRTAFSLDEYSSVVHLEPEKVEDNDD